MEIHELLKANRLQLGLTQKQMADEIISTSFYSRVEQGDSRITAVDLIKILYSHGIDIVDFFSQVTVDTCNEVNQEAEIINNLFISFFNNDLKKVKKEKIKLSELDNPSKKTKVYIKLIETLLSDNASMVDEESKLSIKKNLFSGSNWSIPTLKLFVNSMFIYDTNELTFFVNSILGKYKDTQNEIIQKLVASICVNFLDLNYKKLDFTFWGKSLDFLSKLPNVPDLLMYKLLGKYYQAILNTDENTLMQIKSVLSISGYSNYLDLLP